MCGERVCERTGSWSGMVMWVYQYHTLRKKVMLTLLNFFPSTGSA